MNILAIDTSTTFAGIALEFRGERFARTWSSEHNQGRELMPRILQMFEANDCQMPEIDTIAVALGPGGFSAVRVGVSCALGLANPQRTRMLGIPTHYLQAYMRASRNDGLEGADAIVSLIPVGRNQLSVAEFKLPLGCIDSVGNESVLSKDELRAIMDESDKLYCGEGLRAWNDLPRAGRTTMRDPVHMLDIVADSFRQGIDWHWPIRPIYAREPTITRPRAS